MGKAGTGVRSLFWRIPLRRRSHRRPRILLIDSFAPDPTIGAGVPRMIELLRALHEAGADVIIFPTAMGILGPSLTGDFTAHGATIIDGNIKLDQFLVDRHGQFDAIFVSRAPNMAYARQVLAENPILARNVLLIYDAEALFSEREILMHEVLGKPMAAALVKRHVNDELDLAADTHIVIAVTETIASLFRRAGHRDVRVLGHAVVPQPSPQAFEQRQDFLCVGQALGDESPNADAIVWFADRVLPLLRRELGRDVVLKLAGAVTSPAVQARAGHGIVTMGRVPDLTEAYGSARVFVAPTRYASGIPHKVHEAAARGIPCVITPPLAQQLGWTHGKEVLVATTPKEFAKACLKLYTNKALWTKIRKKALARVAKDCSRRNFDRVVAGLVQDIAKSVQ